MGGHGRLLEAIIKNLVELQAIKDTLDIIVRLMLLALIQQVVVVEAKLLLLALRLKLDELGIILLNNAVSKTTSPLSLSIWVMCGRLYLGLVIHCRVRIIRYSYSPVRDGGGVEHQGIRCFILKSWRMLVRLLLLQKHWLNWMLLLLHDLFLVVAEMIVIHHIILFPARSNEWRRQ